MITKKRKISQIPSTTVLNQDSKILVIHNNSTATISALDIVSGISTISTSHLVDYNNPHQVTKTQVGLSNVDNTSDLDKPVSTATTIALATKQNTLVSGTNIKTINGVSILGSGNISINSGVTSVNSKVGTVSLDTNDIPENGNLYYTNLRVTTVGDSRYVSLTGSYSNPSWLTTLDWSKINSKPNTLAGYGITDSVVLQSVGYSNPAWISTLSFSKLVGVPPFAQNLSELADVDVTGVSQYQILMYNGTQWVSSDNFAQTFLTHLSDVQLNSITSGDLFKFTGTVWENVPQTDIVRWGNVSGDITNQTDLQSALATKADASSVNLAITNQENLAIVYAIAFG